MERVAGTSLHRLSAVGAILIVVLTVRCGDPLPVVEGDLAFVGVTVLPMTGRGGQVVLENQTVVVANRRIVSISPADEVEVGDDVEVIEAAGQYLMPGLAEMHGHLPSPRMLPADAKNLLFLYVANGVTTVRGMQGDRSQFTMRDQIARGETIGPRLFLGSTSMHGAWVTTPEQAAQLVREYKQTGYDLVKVHEDLTLDVFDALAAMANEVGMPFGGHVSDRVGLLHTLELGQVSIDHLDNYIQALVPEERQPTESPGLGDIGALLEVVDEGRIPQLVEATRTARAWVVPTMVLWETAFYGDRSAAEMRTERPEVAYMPPETVREWAQAVDERLAVTNPETNRPGAGVAPDHPDGVARRRRADLAGHRFAADLQRARFRHASRDAVVGRDRDDALSGTGDRYPPRGRVFRCHRRVRVGCRRASC